MPYSVKDIEQITSRRNWEESRAKLGRQPTTTELVENWEEVRERERKLQKDAAKEIRKDGGPSS